MDNYFRLAKETKLSGYTFSIYFAQQNDSFLKYSGNTMKCNIVRSSIPQDSQLLANYRDSLRRHFVDSFYLEKIANLPINSTVLDLGGQKSAKRGLFNIDKYELNVIYANSSSRMLPDVQADGCSLPFIDDFFDCVVCAELLEHIRTPLNVLMEVRRVLHTNGTLFLTVPFMFPIHADPYDYGRYTDQFWLEILSEVGFANISIEWQGGFWCVLFDMFRGYGMEKEECLVGIREKIMNWMNTYPQQIMKKKVLKWDESGDLLKTFYMKGCTTGFGISCQKP